MPIPWLLVLQNVPWTEVIKNAPKVADGAKKLWHSIKGKSPLSSSQSEPLDCSVISNVESIDGLLLRIQNMEATIENLHEQMLASSELIKSLAEQNTQLVKHVEVNNRRILWITVMMVVTGIVALSSLTMVIIY